MVGSGSASGAAEWCATTSAADPSAQAMRPVVDRKLIVVGGRDGDMFAARYFLK